VPEALDMEHIQIPSTKVDPIQTEAFYAEILAALAERVVALERGRDRHAEHIADLEEAVAILLNRESRAKEGEADEAKADDK
jgi:hypothetical protein